MGSWFKAHRKQVITHTAIIVVCAFFTIFCAEPLLDRLERIPGEAQLHRLQLPTETDDIRYAIDDISTEDTIVLEIGGWAFVEGHDSVNSEIYIVLKSTDRTYVFTTEIAVRTDVTQAYKELGLNLDYSGFTALIPLRRVANAEYTVGIYIRKGDIEALQYTDKTIKI